MSNRIPKSPLLQWQLLERGWSVILSGRYLTLSRKSSDVWWLLVDGCKVATFKNFTDGAQIAALLPRYQWNAGMAITADRKQWALRGE